MWPRNDLQNQIDSSLLSPLSLDDSNFSHPERIPLVYRTTFTTITFDVGEIAKAVASPVDEILSNNSPSVMASSRASTIKTPLLNVEECYTVTLTPESMCTCDFEEEFYASLLPPSPESPPSTSPTQPPVQQKPPVDFTSSSHRKKNAALPRPDDSDKEQHELPMTRARARQLHATDSLPDSVRTDVNKTNSTTQRDKLSEAFKVRKATKSRSPDNARSAARLPPKRKESLKRPAEPNSTNKNKKSASKISFERNFEDHEDIARLSQGSMPPVDNNENDNELDGSDNNTEIVSTLNGSGNIAHVPHGGNISATAQISTYTSIFEPAPLSQQQRSAPNIISTTFNSNASGNNISTTTITVNSNVTASRKPAITKPESCPSRPNSIIIQTASQQQRHRNITNPQEASNLSISTRTVRFAADTRFNLSPPQDADLNAGGLMSPPVSTDNGVRGNSLGFSSYFDAQLQQPQQVPIEVDDGSEEDNEQPNETGNSSTKPEAVSIEMEVDDDNEAEVDGGRGGIDSSIVSLDGSNDSQRPPSQAFSQVIVTKPREIRKTTTAAVPKRALNTANTVQHPEISSSSSSRQNILHRTSSQPATQQQQVSIESVRQHTVQFEAQIAATASEVSRRTDAEITSAVTAINSARNNTNLFGTHLRGSATAVAEMRRAIEELNRPRNDVDEFAALNAVIESNVDAESEQIWKLMEERMRAMQAEISSANAAAYTTGRLMAQAMQMQLHMSRRICADSSLYAGALMQTIGQARERMRQVYSRMMQDNVDMLNELGFDQPQQQASRDNNNRAAAVPRGGGARRG